MKNKCQALYATALFLFVTMCPSIALARGEDGKIGIGINGGLILIIFVWVIVAIGRKRQKAKLEEYKRGKLSE